MGEHAFLSPSSGHSAYRCPASTMRSFQVKQRMQLLREVAVEFYGLTEQNEIDRLNKVLEEDNKSAENGTKLHSVFEDAINKNINDKDEIVKRVIEIGVDKSLYSDNYIMDMFHKCIVEQLEAIVDCEWIGVEHRMKIKGLPQFGTVDLTWLSDQVLYIRDLKTGYNEVDSFENEQLMTYAVGILDELGWDQVKEVRIQTLGIRWHSKEWVTDVKTIHNFKHDVMLPAFIAAYNINPKAVAGDHCHYCDAKIHCKEWQDKFEGAANEVFENLDVKDLDSDGLVDLYKLCKQAENLGKFQLAPEILHRFEGFDVPKNIKRVSGAKVEKWSADEPTIVKALKAKVRNKNLLYKQDLLSPKDMKIILGDEEAVEELTEKTTRKPYLKL